MFHWIVLNLTSFSLWLKEQKKLSKNKGCFFSVSLLFFRDMSQKSHFLSGYEIYLLYAWKKTESSAWTLIFMERCTETAEARLLWKKTRGCSFNYKTLERDTVVVQPILLEFFGGKASFFYSYVDDLGDISKSFEIVQPFSCLEGLCHQYENLNFATSRWALKIFGTIGDT